MKIILTAIGSKYIHTALGLRSIRAYAKAHGIETELIEDTVQTPLLAVLAEITGKEPDVVGLSVHIWNKNYVYSLIRLLRKVMPQLKIIAGGPEVSFEPERIFNECPQIDYIVMGEGEEVFVSLINALQQNSEPPAHVAFKKDGRTISSGGTAVVADLDVLEFAYPDLTDVVAGKKIVYYESTRGCPFNCSYCLSGISRNVRKRSLAKVYADLDRMIAAGVVLVKFVDRTFNCKKSHAMAIWQFIRDHDNGVTNFHFEIAADILDEEEIALLKTMRPGLVQLEIGVQTANPDTIHSINRKMDLARVAQVTEKIRQFHNIHQHLDLIAGLPLEDYESFGHSFDVVYQMKPSQLQLGFLKVLKGSYMEELIPTCDLLYSAAPPYEVLCTKWLSYGDVLELKDIEEMTEVHYNSRQFTCTLKELEKEFDTPYEMFSFMAGYYNKNHLFGISHSRIARYEILWKIIQERLEKNGKCETQGKPENGGVSEKLEQYRDLLMTDLYLRENVKKRPDFAGDYTLQKDELRYINEEILLKDERLAYFGQKNMRKFSHMEQFDHAVNEDFKETILLTKTILLFDYQNRDPLTNQATVYPITMNLIKNQ